MCSQQTIIHELKKTTICLLILILLFSCSDNGSNQFENSPIYHDNFNISYDSKISIIQFFKEVAIGTEYGGGYDVTQKWSSVMNIFVGGNPSAELISELNLIITEINELVTDGFSVHIVNDSLKSNFYMFFGSPNDYTDLFAEQLNYISDNNFGLFHINLDKNFVITSGHMYVNIDIEDITLKKHILREELTQSLGLPKDLQYDRSIIFLEPPFNSSTWTDIIENSIFYEGMSTRNSYNWADKLVVKLLYHPNMRSGLDIENVDTVLKGILGII